MLIRSQNKKIIIDLCSTTIKTANNVIFAYGNNLTSDAWDVLGKYDSEEKCIKVMDMICSVYADRHSIFDMPYNGEVI